MGRIPSLERHHREAHTVSSQIEYPETDFDDGSDWEEEYLQDSGKAKIIARMPNLDDPRPIRSCPRPQAPSFWNGILSKGLNERTQNRILWSMVFVLICTLGVVFLRGNTTKETANAPVAEEPAEIVAHRVEKTSNHEPLVDSEENALVANSAFSQADNSASEFRDDENSLVLPTTSIDLTADSFEQPLGDESYALPEQPRSAISAWERGESVPEHSSWGSGSDRMVSSQREEPLPNDSRQYQQDSPVISERQRENGTMTPQSYSVPEDRGSQQSFERQDRYAEQGYSSSNNGQNPWTDQYQNQNQGYTQPQGYSQDQGYGQNRYSNDPYSQQNYNQPATDYYSRNTTPQQAAYASPNYASQVSNEGSYQAAPPADYSQYSVPQQQATNYRSASYDPQSYAPAGISVNSQANRYAGQSAEAAQQSRTYAPAGYNAVNYREQIPAVQTYDTYRGGYPQESTRMASNLSAAPRYDGGYSQVNQAIDPRFQQPQQSQPQNVVQPQYQYGGY